VRTFGEWVYQQRKERGWTQDELAHRVKRSKSYISAIERDESHSQYGHDPMPRKETVDLIAEAFGVDPAVPRLILGYAPESVGPGSPVLFSGGGNLTVINMDEATASVSKTIEAMAGMAEMHERAAAQLRAAIARMSADVKTRNTAA